FCSSAYSPLPLAGTPRLCRLQLPDTAISVPELAERRKPLRAGAGGPDHQHRASWPVIWQALIAHASRISISVAELGGTVKLQKAPMPRTAGGILSGCMTAGAKVG